MTPGMIVTGILLVGLGGWAGYVFGWAAGYRHRGREAVRYLGIGDVMDPPR